MYDNLSLSNFRSYSDESFEFDKGVNIIVGPNGSGKTNLLEALLVISKGSSYRAKDADLIQKDKDWLRLETVGTDLSRKLKIEHVDEKRTNKSYEINGKELHRLSIDNSIPVVLFEPNTLLVFIGSPELRRNYFDDILDQLVVGFRSTRLKYKKALTQRNILLRSKPLNKKELFAWDLRMSELGGEIYKQRQQLLDKINEDISEIYDQLSAGKEKIKLEYDTPVTKTNYASNLMSKMESNLTVDIERGSTGFGPHRDNIVTYINDKKVSIVASRGESRSIMLSLKMIEARLIKENREKSPVLLFDDVFSELDGARRLALTKLIEDYQTFITTTDADVVIQYFTENCNIIART